MAQSYQTIHTFCGVFSLSTAFQFPALGEIFSLCLSILATSFTFERGVTENTLRYRATTRVTSRALQERLDALTVDAYNMAVEQLVARAEALRPAPIREQMVRAGQEADKANASRPAPEKGKEARDDR